MHACERRVAEALQLSPSEREGLTIQTKAGIVRQGYYDFSYQHLTASVEASLAALQTDYIDILLLHRPDALVEPEEVARAFDDLQSAGKVRHFGVSNHTPPQIELLKTAVRQPLVVNQVQLSLPQASLIAQGIAANMQAVPQSASRDLGLVDYSRLAGMTLQAWSPFQGGDGAGPFVGNRERFAELNDELDRVAAGHGVTPTAIATAWITRHPANIQVVVGTTSESRLSEAAAGADIVLTRAEWYALFRAADYTVP